MKRIGYMLLFISSSLFAQDIGGDYYVAHPDSSYSGMNAASDSNDGSYANPWATWNKAFETAGANTGDTVYFRGGVYHSKVDHSVDSTGTSSNPLCFWAYPGETPILDCTYQCDSIPGRHFNSAIHVDSKEYIHFKGLTVRNVFQCDSVVTGAVTLTTCANLTFENMTLHNIGQRGFYYSGGAWGDHAPDPIFESDSTYWINCDVYDLCDSFSTFQGASTAGNAADGWKTIHYGDNYIEWRGCRAWNFSDDGFDPNNIDGSTFVFEDCWVMPSNKYAAYCESQGTSLEGNGFKISAPQHDLEDTIQLTYTNCLAMFGAGTGFYTNLYLGGNGHWELNARVYNNTAYYLNIGFSDTDGETCGNDSCGNYADSCTSIYRNNIAWGATSEQDPYDPLYEVNMSYTKLLESNNTWDHVEDSWPGWEYASDVTISDADFVTVDSTTLVSQFTAARQGDWSLPATKPLSLANGSDMIDAGIQVPESDSVSVTISFNGSAPDIGYAESNYNAYQIRTNAEGNFLINAEGEALYLLE